MSGFETEPSLDDVLSDPMIHVLMQRDRVDVVRLRGFLEDIRGKLGQRATSDVLKTAARQWIAVSRRAPAIVQ